MATANIISQRLLVKAPLQFRKESEAIPETLEKDYLVRVDVCGICRSDLYAATNWARDWEEAGHEFGGTIVAARHSLGRFHVGQRVAVRNASACLGCPHCRDGRFRECRNLVVNMQGYRDYSQCDERSLVAAEGLDDDLLALVEPTNVVLDLLDAAQLDDSDRILVFGSGTLGLIASYLIGLRLKAAPLLMVGRRPQEPLSMTLGIQAYSSFESATRNAIQSHLGGLPSAVFVTTPPATLTQALELCAPGGRIFTVGLDREDSCLARLDTRALIFKRVSLRGVFAVPNLFFEDSVSVLGAHGEPLRSLIRHRIRRDELERYFLAWHARGSFDGKAIVLGNQTK